MQAFLHMHVQASAANIVVISASSSSAVDHSSEGAQEFTTHLQSATTSLRPHPPCRQNQLLALAVTPLAEPNATQSLHLLPYLSS